MLFDFVNAFISFRYQWTYIFIIRWISYGSHNLTCYYHCCFFLKWHSYFLGFVLAFMESLSPHITTPMPLTKICWSGNEVYTPLPLHPNRSITTPEWQCRVNLHICDALQCHSGVTLRCHSQSTLQCHSRVHTPLPLHYYHSNATLTEHSNATPECLWSVNLHICDALLCHSNTTP